MISKNRLVKVTNNKNEIIAEYSYDTLGRRALLRQDYEGQVAKKVVSYTYAGNNAILEETFEQEKDKLELKEIKENIYSNSIDDILASIITKDGKSKVYYYTKNQLGSITSITDEKGKVVEEYKYDVFGKAYIRNGKSDNWREFKESKIDNTRLFTGREYDREIGLYYYRARYYSADLGRFISRDPIGQVDDINLYSYVGNNSVNFVDPSGLEKSLININVIGGFFYELIGFETAYAPSNEDVNSPVIKDDYGLYGDEALFMAGFIGFGKASKVEAGIKTTEDVLKNLSEHAFERMKERGISTDDILNTINNGEVFEYVNNGVKKIGYYLEESNIFVGMGDKITTVIKPTKNYINNLKNTLGK